MINNYYKKTKTYEINPNQYKTDAEGKISGQELANLTKDSLDNFIEEVREESKLKIKKLNDDAERRIKDIRSRN